MIMKTYSNIEDLYREKFSDYSPEPPAEVWERIQQAKGRKLSVKGKAAIFTTAAVVVAIVSYWGIHAFSPDEDKVENQQNEQIIAENSSSETTDIVQEEVISSQNEPLVVMPVSLSVLTQDVVVERLELDEFNNPNNEVAVSAAPPKTEKETEAKAYKTTVEIKGYYKFDKEKIKNNPEIPVEIAEGRKQKEEGRKQRTENSVEQTEDNTEIEDDITESRKVKAELFIPNAFTPNGDGLNDEFKVQSEEEYTYFEMSIYSRDGKMLFNSKDIKHGWDGRYKGVPQSHGSYIYLIRYKDAFGKIHDKQGTFLLLLQ